MHPAFGSVDLALDLGIDCDSDGREDELLHFRSQLVLASRLAGLAAPVDGVSTAVDDIARVGADAERARRLGFGAKLCIHPKQVAPVQAAFSPTAMQVAWARRAQTAFATAAGAAVAVDGQMIDRPLNERALAILRRAGIST